MAWKVKLVSGDGLRLVADNTKTETFCKKESKRSQMMNETSKMIFPSTLGTFANALCRLMFNPDSCANKQIGLLEPEVDRK